MALYRVPVGTEEVEHRAFDLQVACKTFGSIPARRKGPGITPPPGNFLTQRARPLLTMATGGATWAAPHGRAASRFPEALPEVLRHRRIML